MEVHNRYPDADFRGWATRNDLRCTDGRTIRKDAFKHCDGKKVPLLWNHQHNDHYNVLGHAFLENCAEGVYAYGFFNETESGQNAKKLVHSGDIEALSIFANQLQQRGADVLHGDIKELSLVLAGANPGAFIDSVIRHGEAASDEEAIIYTGEHIILSHADDEKKDEPETKEDESEKTITEVMETLNEEQREVVDSLIGAALSEGDADDSTEEGEEGETVEHSDSEDKESGKSVAEVLDSLTEVQQKVVFGLIGTALEQSGVTAESNDETVEHSDDNSEGGNEIMHNNIFDQSTAQTATLSHADQVAIMDLAKSSSVGSLQEAIKIYAEANKDTLAHGWESIGQLFPDFKDVHPGAPELIERDMSWVNAVMKKAKKSPISRIRTRQADARATELRAKGYNDRQIAKKLGGSLKLLMRTTEPQTVYVRDELHRDDKNDITDFDVAAYQMAVMRHNYEETVALAALVGDQREETDGDKIHEDRIRPIWKDEELYTIHYDIDTEGTRAELQGSNTNANFGANFIRAESMVNAALYAREGYKGKGQPDMFIDPHELNVMLLARDLNGRRIYDSVSDLAKAMNVGEIHTVEQFSGLTRTTEDGKTKKLLALFVNMSNYQFGATKGGELTSFEQFDIDFNKYKYLMEGRLSGALTEIKSAIAIEEDVTE